MKYELKVLSPVHVGTGKKITPFEFAFSDGTFVVVDMDKVLEANPRRADDLNDRLSLDSVRFSLSEFLKKEEIENTAFWKYSAALDPGTKQVLREELHKAKDMDVDECIKTTADCQVYVPGSSLKGVFRTALAYSTFQRDEKLYKELKTRLERIDWRRSDEAVNELIFWGARNDPKYDLFKILSLSDSSSLPANEQTLEIGKMKILSLTSEAQKPISPVDSRFAVLQQLRSSQQRSPMKHWWTIQEVLKPGISFIGTVSIANSLLHNTDAKKLLKWKKPHQRDFSQAALIQAANIFALDICKWELNFFEKEVNGIEVKPILDFYNTLKHQIEHAEKNICYLCIGQGAGWHKMTIGMLLENDKSLDFRKLRKTLRLAQDRLNFEFPKSRKLLMKSEDEFDSVFGWLEVKFV